MKLSIKHIGLGALLVIVAILFFTSIGTSARRYVGVIKSQMTVALKRDKKLPPETYEWRLIDRDGHDLQFGMHKGKVIFLNFWATWCKPCIKELPDIQELYKAYGEKVVFLLVTQEDSMKVNAFIKKRDLNVPIYYAPVQIPDAVFSKTLPTTYIINKKGQVVLAETGVSDWNGQETRLLLNRLITE